MAVDEYGEDQPLREALGSDEDDDGLSDQPVDDDPEADSMHIDTPPASPPPSPPPPEDPDDRDIDGFVDVTHEDLEIYERWYAEDCEQELREFRESPMPP